MSAHPGVRLPVSAVAARLDQEEISVGRASGGRVWDPVSFLGRARVPALPVRQAAWVDPWAPAVALAEGPWGLAANPDSNQAWPTRYAVLPYFDR